jgi:hypothetical protein
LFPSQLHQAGKALWVSLLSLPPIAGRSYVGSNTGQPELTQVLLQLLSPTLLWAL